jgi:CRISPR-associated protein, TM1812 family
MSKKVLIAGIGGGKNKETGTYRVANYKIENKIYEQRSFITSALEEHYGIDKTIFIGTTGSMWDNLYEFYSKKFQKDYDENYHLDLMAIIDNATMDTNIDSLNLSKFNETFNDKIVAIVTKYGMNELEIFENFNLIIKLQDELEDGDEVYLDITHSFRSNAFWMFLVMNYLTDVEDKNIEVKAITYGMLEAQKDGVAPVVDLNAFYKILQWIKGANNLKNYGNSYLIEENIENEKLSKKLKNFSDALNMNYIGSLRQSINSLKKLEDDIDNLEGPAKLIIPKVIKDFMDRFASEDKDYLFQAKLAKWHFEQKRYAMAYININESIIGFILDTLELPLLTGDRKKDENKLAKDWLNMIISRHENNKTYPNFKVDKDNMELNDIDSLKKYCDKIIVLLENRDFIVRMDDKLQFSKKIKKDL